MRADVRTDLTRPHRSRNSMSVSQRGRSFLPYHDAVTQKLHFVPAGGLLLMAACGGPNYGWTPHKLEYERPGRQQTYESVLVYDGDIEALIRANAVLMGSLRTRNTEAARAIAPRYGGTHVLHIADRSYNDKLWTRCDTYANTTWCSDTTRQIPVHHFAVIRVERERWDDLPDLLHPQRSARGDLSCQPLPEPPRGCSYSQDDFWGGERRHRPGRLFLHCQGEPYPKEVTALLRPASCTLPSGS